jgi:hypothetical protein
LTPAKRSSGRSSKPSGKGGSTKGRASTDTRKRPAGGARGGSGSKGEKSRGSQGSTRRSSLEDRLDELQPWQRWHEQGPQATGLGRMQQWVSAYAEGTLEADEGDAPGPSGVIAD